MRLPTFKPAILYHLVSLPKFLAIFLVAAVFTGVIYPLLSVKAIDPVDELQQQIDDLAHLKQMSEDATKPLESELDNLETKIENARNGIASAKKQASDLSKSIEEREGKLAEQYMILSHRVADQYKRSRVFSPLLTLFAASDASKLTQDLAYRSSVEAQDKRLITEVSSEIEGLEADKQKLESDQVRLAALEKQLDSQAEFFRKEIEGAKKYQQQLSGQIAALSARQQEIIGNRQASLNLPSSLGAGPLSCVDDRKIDPGFGSGFAFFTYGIPHRVGLNQYGAYGRAKSGQSYDQILRAYFNFDQYQEGVNFTIKVNDSNSFGKGNIIWSGSLEDYMKRIYEVPASWPMESLKAQAVAARSYVLATTNNGSESICATQYCQVFKTDPKGGDWDTAVSETSGKVMVAGGQIIKAWFASTAGGYTFNSGDVWSNSTSYTKRLRDTNGDVNSFSDLNEKAYDKDSPCFYSAQGYRSQYNKSAWLKPEEVADIANSILLARADSSLGDHLYQPDKPHPYGGEIWDSNRVKEELRQRNITPFQNVTSISVSADFSVGRTTTMTINGDGKNENFPGDEFRNWFNLRAPANIQIVGPLFNVEKR